MGRIRKVVTKKEDRTRKDRIGKERRSTKTRKDGIGKERRSIQGQGRME